jgi:hypothetical protein
MEVRGANSVMTCRNACQFRPAKLRRRSPFASFDIDAYEDCFVKGFFVEHFDVIRNKLIPLVLASWVVGRQFRLPLGVLSKRSP